MENLEQEGQPSTLTEVANNGWDRRLRLFRAGNEVDTAALVTERYVILIDTMATPELAAAIMERLHSALTGRQLLVINTHADYDHCWGNALFAAPGGSYPAPIIAHEQARRRLQSAEARKGLDTVQCEGSRFANVRLVAPTITFTDSLRIDGGDLTLELIPTPGHTVDHISVWIPELRLLLAGDAAEHPFPCVDEGAPETLPILRQSLARLAALNAAAVIPCHGGTTDPALIMRNIAYFDEIARRVRGALAAGLIPPDWETREDIAEVIGLPFEQAVKDQGADPEDISGWYRLLHRTAVRATLENLHASHD